MTAVHPESYDAARNILKILGYSTDDIASGKTKAIAELISAIFMVVFSIPPIKGSLPSIRSRALSNTGFIRDYAARYPESRVNRLSPYSV